ncbi:MAG: DUF5606 domain-containing protein [Bacteroidales bacterium]|nr:DUF5606 domain-containing protein [Bacteroidales bacterium]
MNLKDILTISGKPGLFKLVANNKNGFIAESLTDKKRIPVFARDKVSALDEISIFTNDDEKRLKKVLSMLYVHQDKKPVDKTVISDNKALIKLFGDFFPEYDAERFYTSHMKKVCQWYNELLAEGLVDENGDDETEDKATETEQGSEDKAE